MSRLICKWIGCVGLTALLFLLALCPQATADNAAALRKEIRQLADLIHQGKPFQTRANAIRLKYRDIATLMEVYEPEIRTAVGIETSFRNLAKRALSRAELLKTRADLLQLGYTNLAIGEVTALHAPKRTARAARIWKENYEDMQKATREFIAAVKANEPADIKRAATKITTACTDCHDSLN